MKLTNTNRIAMAISVVLGLGAVSAHAGGGPAPVAAGCPGAGTIWPYDGGLFDKVAVRSRFHIVILCNLQHNPNVNSMIAAMAPVDLARLSTQFDLAGQVYGGPKIADLLATSAQRLTAANLIKLRSAVGIETDAAVARYSSLAVQSSYFATVKAAPVIFSRAKIQSNGLRVKAGTVTAQGTIVPSPILDMTLYEVYLEYYTAGWTASAALAGAATFITSQVVGAFGAGYAIGTGIYWASDQVDEGINIWIGDQVGPIISYLCKGGICTRN